MKTTTPSTDTSLWILRPAFGVAGGPVEVVLSDEGSARAFSVGAQVRRGKPAEALETLATMPDGLGFLSVRSSGAKIKATVLGRFDEIAWGVLRSLGYVESVPPEPGVHESGVRLTASGTAAVANGHAERARLLDRCRRAVAHAADDAYSAELHRVFGKDAGDARYDARGTSTPELRRLSDAKLVADAACV